MHPLLFAPIVLLLAAAPEGEVDTQAEQVRCAETAFSDSVEFGDWDAFESLVYSDARFAADSSPARVGAATIRERWERSYSRDDRTLRWRSRSVEIIRPGEVALSRGPYRLRIQGEDGEITETWGTFNSIWLREGNRWQVAFDLGSEGTEEGDPELIESGGKACPGSEHDPPL
jgi:ketosteroid isomerase-like protein